MNTDDDAILVTAALPTAPEQKERRQAHRGRVVAAAAASVLVVGGAVAWNWPTDKLAEEPGPILDLATRVKVTGGGASPTPIHGAFDGLTVVLQPLDLGQVVLNSLTGDHTTVVSKSDVDPPGVDPTAYGAFEKAEYVDGAQVAAAVAEKALGYAATTHDDGLEIYGVAHDTPASAASLQTGDVITAVDGQSVDAEAALASAIKTASAQAPLTLTIQRTGTTREVSLVPTTIPGATKPAIGIVVAPANSTVDLPVPVTSDASGVVGPSAGLMTALTVYDELSPTDLAAGRHIAGTGTIDADGNVGEIGGIQAKARAALAAGAQLFLAPASQAADARAVLGTKVPVVGVTSFADALTALQALPSSGL